MAPHVKELKRFVHQRVLQKLKRPEFLARGPEPGQMWQNYSGVLILKHIQTSSSKVIWAFQDSFLKCIFAIWPLECLKMRSLAGGKPIWILEIILAHILAFWRSEIRPESSLFHKKSVRPFLTFGGGEKLSRVPRHSKNIKGQIAKAKVKHYIKNYATCLIITVKRNPEEY